MAKNASKSSAKSSHGGKRSGAGRKRSLVKALRSEVRVLEGTPAVLAEVDATLLAILPRCVANLIKLANGGYERVADTFRVMPQKEDSPYSPELVLSERKIETAEPDRAANQILIERCLGKATQRHEHDIARLSDDELIRRATGDP
jgi:hypothetical protein